MYFSFIMGGKKKAFKSHLRNMPPLYVSDIVMLAKIFIQIRLEAVEPSSTSYGSLYLTTTKITLHGSIFNG